jgi:hypothetical protein
MTDNDTDANARATACALIKGYLGPDQVIDMRVIFTALVQAITRVGEGGEGLGTLKVQRLEGVNPHRSQAKAHAHSLHA